MENKGKRKSLKVGVAAAIAIVVAGVSIYATSASAGESITEAEAKQIALAEVKGADISHITKFQKDKDDGRSEYDVEIIYDGFEYDFEISAKDGTIFDQSKEKADVGDLAKLEAKDAVKEEVKEESKADAQSESNNSVQNNEQESNKTVVVEQPTAASESNAPSDIGLDRAKSIALGQVSGASSGNITKAYKDYDDGRAEYDIEIRYNGYEYEFEISAASGNILSKDVDRVEQYDDDDRDDDDWDDDGYDDDDDRYDD